MAPPPDPSAPRTGGAHGRPTIGAATAVRGQLAAREDITIDGQFEGEIQAAGHQVTVGSGGRVRGQVRARAVVVEGELHGEVVAEQHATVRSGGRFQGDLRAARVALEDGCRFDGTVDMSPQALAAATAKVAGAFAAAEGGAGPRSGGAVDPPATVAAAAATPGAEPVPEPATAAAGAGNGGGGPASRAGREGGR